MAPTQPSTTLAKRDPDLSAFRDRLEAVDRFEPKLIGMADLELRRRFRSLRDEARAGASLDDLLPEVFALAREASRRTLGMRPFEVQIAGGIALHEGRVTEMATGEGKTLAAVAPVLLHALADRGAHVLTFNDYLARRDALWMGPIYELLGVSVRFISEGMEPAERRRAYQADVTYLTAKEAGFDLLRDGLCLETEDQVHRPLHFALVDEADSILIDEARIPLVIAGALEAQTAGLGRLADLARQLTPVVHFDTDDYAHNISLTEAGARVLEAELGCDNLFAPESIEILADIRNSLHAQFLLHRDVDYIVRRGSVELVDELTGRIAENRQWPNGLQAAVEAKEGLRLGADGRILGSITLQHFLKLYPHLCGMTATARSAATELSEIYGLEVATIPPHRPCIRIDEPDRIYTHSAARDLAVLKEIEHIHRTGRPILVGTVSVAESERLASELMRRGMNCRVLNAKNDEEEAAVVAEAGALGAVTISTNMAGRGTDIRLGGAEERERTQVRDLGGLFVLGTHRHESRRIDRQLRGRAGRQGDPGSSRFFVTLDDDLLQRYRIDRLISEKLFPERTDDPIESSLVAREMARAQRVVEGECFDVRRRLYAYSEILEKQRLYLQRWRQAVLNRRWTPRLLGERRRERWDDLGARFGSELVSKLERRLTLLMIDRCWGEYLTEMQAIRDEIHLVALDGREPLAEFYRTALQAFERLLEQIDERVVEEFDRMDVAAEGVDWDADGLRGPTATWTYLVSDNIFGSNVLLSLANRPSYALWGVIMLGPLLFLWGLYLRWRRRHDSRRQE